MFIEFKLEIKMNLATFIYKDIPITECILYDR